MLKLVKNAVRKLFHHYGFEIHGIPENLDFREHVYAPVSPSATYNPWNRDAEFNQVYDSVKDYTMVDRYRCYELWKLVEQCAKLGSGSIIEIGVWRGGTGALIARQALNCKIKDRVFLCDTFTGIIKAGSKDSAYSGGEHADTSKQMVEELVSQQLSLDNVDVLEGIFPDQTGQKIEDLTFRLCHIDVDVYQSAKDIVGWIWDKIVPGGIIVYDDYGFKCADGISKHVEEQMHLKDRLIIHNLNGHSGIFR